MRANNNRQYAALLEALHQCHSTLTREGASRLFCVTPTAEALNEQPVSGLIATSPKKRRGPRVAVRTRRHYHQHQVYQARWPNDGMEEVTIPSLGFILRGQADFTVMDYVLHARVGDCLVFPPGIAKQDGSRPHIEGDSTNRFCDVLWLCSSTVNKGIRCWVCRSEGDQHYSQGDLGTGWVAHPFLAQLFLEFCSEMVGARRTEIALHLLHSVLLLLRSEIEQGHVAQKWGKNQEAETPPRADLIAEAQAYMKENLEQHLTIEKVARQISVSTVTLTRHFKERTGQTFQQYHTELRLQRATQLLQETNFSITFISYYVGLKYGQLRALFQQKYGCSPGEFRLRQNRLNNDG